MDFNVNTTMPAPYQKSSAEQFAGNDEVRIEKVIKAPQSQEIELQRNEYLEDQKVRVENKFLSGLNNMQNFLFVMIGSELKLSQEHKPVGNSLDRIA